MLTELQQYFSGNSAPERWLRTIRLQPTVVKLIEMRAAKPQNHALALGDFGSPSFLGDPNCHFEVFLVALFLVAVFFVEAFFITSLRSWFPFGFASPFHASVFLLSVGRHFGAKFLWGYRRKRVWIRQDFQESRR